MHFPCLFFLSEKHWAEDPAEQSGTRVCHPMITNPGRDVGEKRGNKHLEEDDSAANLKGVISCCWVNQLG